MNHGRQIKRIAILVGVCVLLLCVGFYYVYGQIRAMNEHTSVLENDVTLQVEKEQYLISMNKTIEGINSNLAKIDESLVKSDGDVDFIKYIETLARSSGLKVSLDGLTVDTDSTLDPANLSIFRIRAKTDGNWAGTYTFLSKLEASTFKIKIDRMLLSESSNDFAISSPKKAGTSNVSWQGTFEIHVLKYKK